MLVPRISVESNPRFTMDIPPLEKARLVRAAFLQHTTLKDFLLRNALQAADTVIDRAERIALSEHDTQKIMDLLDNPRAANPRMVAALKTMPPEVML
jgi:uncharacterized protein (DUF1778 family)